MRILHTESSNGWGGQEIRILREAEGMRNRGHEVIFAVVQGGTLAKKAQESGFSVYELPPYKIKNPSGFIAADLNHQPASDRSGQHPLLLRRLDRGDRRPHHRQKSVRTRHLSAPTRKGINSFIVYRILADYVVTTSSVILPMIQQQARLSQTRVQCIPTGVDPSRLTYQQEEAAHFRRTLGVNDGDILVGTVCVVRSWKGIVDFLKAAQLLKDHQQIKWVIVGGGHVHDYTPKLDEMGLHGRVTFTGHLDTPYAAIAAMDIFALLSTANEGISQATLQASYLEKPLITTSIGGLPEVCLDGETGIVVPPFSPEKIAEAETHTRPQSQLTPCLWHTGKSTCP